MSASRAHSSEPSEDQLVALLRQHAEPLPALDEPRFADAFERYADARVVQGGQGLGMLAQQGDQLILGWLG